MKIVCSLRADVPFRGMSMYYGMAGVGGTF